MRISDLSSDVCSSDLPEPGLGTGALGLATAGFGKPETRPGHITTEARHAGSQLPSPQSRVPSPEKEDGRRSEEHTSELQSLMRLSYADFCLKKKKKNIQHIKEYTTTYITT